jgi:SAM-dependent methyltransferase
MSKPPPCPPDFDSYAGDYDAALAQGIRVSGEDKNYFARGRVAWLASCLHQLGEQPQYALDYGCGTGSASPFLLDLLGVQSLLGLDLSAKSLEVAQQAHGSPRARFLLFEQYKPDEQMDLVFCNGVFHHIPMAERAAAVHYIYQSLRPGGLFALWENNPWNPGTRYVMSRIPFDRDAIPLAPPESRRLVRTGGFAIVRTDFLFIFPRLLWWLRWLEPLVSRLPFGSQYLVLGRKPSTAETGRCRN